MHLLMFKLIRILYEHHMWWCFLWPNLQLLKYPKYPVHSAYNSLVEVLIPSVHRVSDTMKITWWLPGGVAELLWAFLDGCMQVVLESLPILVQDGLRDTGMSSCWRRFFFLQSEVYSFQSQKSFTSSKTTVLFIRAEWSRSGLDSNQQLPYSHIHPDPRIWTLLNTCGPLCHPAWQECIFSRAMQLSLQGQCRHGKSYEAPPDSTWHPRWWRACVIASMRS